MQCKTTYKFSLAKQNKETIKIFSQDQGYLNKSQNHPPYIIIPASLGALPNTQYNSRPPKGYLLHVIFLNGGFLSLWFEKQCEQSQSQKSSKCKFVRRMSNGIKANANGNVLTSSCGSRDFNLWLQPSLIIPNSVSKHAE